MSNILLADVSVNGRGYYGIGAPAVSFSNELYTYLRITDINDDGTLNLSDLKSVAAEQANEYLLCKNDIVFARTGASTGRNYFYDGTDGKFVYAGFLIKFSIDPLKINPKYVKYYCLSKQYKDWIRSFTTGSTRGNINAQTLSQMPIPMISRKQQDILVDILSSIDNKIRQNTTINNNLEQQAQAIFKAWFVDFITNSSVMPSSWKTAPLSTITRISTEVFSPLKNPNVEVEHYSIPAYDEKCYPVLENSNGIKSNKYRLTNNSIMISKLNPDTKRIWRPYCISNTPVCSTEFIVYEPIKPTYRDFVYSIIDSDKFSNFLCAHTTGSTNSRQRSTPNVTLNYDIVLPDEESIGIFTSIVSPMYDTIEKNIEENQLLTETRDRLLPKLMSGELDISGIEL